MCNSSLLYYPTPLSTQKKMGSLQGGLPRRRWKSANGSRAPAPQRPASPQLALAESARRPRLRLRKLKKCRLTSASPRAAVAEKQKGGRKSKSEGNSRERSRGVESSKGRERERKKDSNSAVQKEARPMPSGSSQGALLRKIR